MSVTLNGTSGLVFGDGTIQGTAAGNSFRNKVINGEFKIDQRTLNAYAEVSPTDGTWVADRWQNQQSAVTSVYKVQINGGSYTPPAGYNTYLRVSAPTAFVGDVNSYVLLRHKIEGLNTVDLAFGSSSAKAITLSFWVRSSKAGTYGGIIQNSNYDYNYTYSYTVDSANTWEQKSVTIPGATAGAWLTTNGVGLDFWFSVMCGSTNTGTPGSWVVPRKFAPTGQVNPLDTNGGYFCVTGVQLEAAAAKTDFERRSYSTEMALCQRYYWRNAAETLAVPYVSNSAPVGTSCYAWWTLPVAMRTTPSCTYSTQNMTSINTRTSSVYQIAMLASHVGSGGAGYINEVTASAEL